MLLFRGKINAKKITLRRLLAGGLAYVLPIITAYALPPQITSVGPTDAVVNGLYTYQVQANDPEGSAISFALQSAPDSMTITNTGLISWTPTATQAGENVIKIRILDAENLREYQFVYVKVVDPDNSLPVVEGQPVTSVNFGERYTYELKTSDGDGDRLSYRIQSEPLAKGLQIDDSGIITWIPSIDDMGVYSITVYIDDGRSGEITKSYSLYVNNPDNNVPIISQQPLPQTTYGQRYTYDLQASDADGDQLTYTVSSTPELPGIQINSSGVFSWIPTRENIGVYLITLTVNDGRQGVAQQKYELTVIDPDNQLPVINGEPVTQINYGTRFTYDLQASDADGDALTYTLIAPKLATEMQIDEEGVITWNPTRENVGELLVNVKIDDGLLGVVFKQFTLNVVDPNNQSPSFTSSPIIQGAVGNLYQYQVVAQDAEGDSIGYFLSEAPSGMSIDESTGILQWTPDTVIPAPGIPVKIRARDNYGGSAVHEFQITVDAVNTAPSVNTAFIKQTHFNEVYTYDLQAIDADGDPLTYTFVGDVPSGMTLDLKGVVSWIPTRDQVGYHDIYIEVADDHGAQTAVEYKLTVIDPNNRVPIIGQQPITQIVYGTPYTYDIQAKDADGDQIDYQIRSRPSVRGLSISKSGVVTWTATRDDVGEIFLTIKVDDGHLGIVNKRYHLNVIDPLNQAPVFTSTPITQANIGTPYQYNVTASDSEGDNISYQISDGPNGMDIDPVTGLVQWIPSAGVLASGEWVKIQADDNHGGITQQEFKIIVVADNSNDLAPVILSTGPSSVQANTRYNYSVKAMDKQGDKLTYGLSEAPTGMTIDAESGLIDWTPTDKQSGVHRVTLNVSDGLFKTTQSLEVTVGNINQRLVAVPQVITVIENTGATITLSGDDTSSDSLSYEVTSSVSHGTITDLLPNLMYMPAKNFVGTDQFTFIISDGESTSAPATVVIAVVKDLDGDGIADIQDDDRDGDAVSNEDELALGTDPDNGADYPDTVGPSLSVRNPSTTVTYSNFIVISGTAIDPLQHHSGIEQVKVTSNRYKNNVFIAMTSDDVFRVEVPLKIDTNTLTVTATDTSGNSTTDTIVVNRQSPPGFKNLTPANGSIVDTDIVTIAGEVRTKLPLTDVSFFINQWQVNPDDSGVNGVYPFSLKDIPLQFGDNTFVLTARTNEGDHSNTLTIKYAPPNVEEIPAPEITVHRPANGALVNTDNITLDAQVKSHGGPLAIEINGNGVVLDGNTGTNIEFSEIVSFAKGVNTLNVTITATDSLGKTTNKTLRYRRDVLAPKVTLDNSLSVYPFVNKIKSAPYIITGSVRDIDLVSLMVNDEAVTLMPGAGEGSYTFLVSVGVRGGQTIPINIVAKDLSGNESATEYIIENTATTDIDLLSPKAGDKLFSTGEPIDLKIVAQVGQLQIGDTVQASLNGGELRQLTTSGILALGDMNLPVFIGDHTLYVELRNSQNQIISTTQSTFSVVSSDQIPAVLTRVEPVANADFVEPNQAIELYFNKSIDLDKLTLSVRETLHGKTYINKDPLGQDFINVTGYQLQEVHRDAQLLQGELALQSGGIGVAFYPKYQFGFGAQITVDVSYDGKQLSSSEFKVRELPTFVQGTVSDQFGQPLANISVEMPELNRKTTTNKNGGFAFGYQEGGDQIIPQGRYQLLINDQLVNTDFGMASHKIDVQQHQRNNLGNYTLTELNQEITFQQVVSGQTNNLAGNDLILDLTNAQAVFADGKTSGNVHTQFLAFEHLNVNFLPRAMPLWLFSNQPKGITLEGNVGLSIKIPKLAGSYDYLPSVYKYVMLVAYNPEVEVVEPVGIGRINEHRVESIGPLTINNLDYIGYAVVDLLYQNLLEAVANGNQPLQSLKAILR